MISLEYEFMFMARNKEGLMGRFLMMMIRALNGFFLRTRKSSREKLKKDFDEKKHFCFHCIVVFVFCF